MCVSNKNNNNNVYAMIITMENCGFRLIFYAKCVSLSSFSVIDNWQCVRLFHSIFRFVFDLVVFIDKYFLAKAKYHKKQIYWWHTGMPFGRSSIRPLIIMSLWIMVWPPIQHRHNPQWIQINNSCAKNKING